MYLLLSRHITQGVLKLTVLMSMWGLI